MREVLDDIAQWLEQGLKVALATVVGTEGSSPREPGAVMAVNEAGDVLGSVSGGCVEAAVVEEGLAVLAQGKPKLLSYGVTDELGLEVGLTCGGTIHIFVEKVTQEVFAPIIAAVRHSEKQPVAICTLIEGKQAGAKLLITENAASFDFLGHSQLEQVIAKDAQGLLAQGQTQLRHYGLHGERRQTGVSVFIESFAPPPHLIIFGAVDFTRSLSKLGKLLGYHVTVCDARSRFATKARFPEADEVVVAWPHKYLQSITVDARSAIAVLTHDPKFDVPALVSAINTPAAYIGAMGSRKSHADRLERLREAGLSQAQISRICAPIGLDIGARTPEETAVSIMAEVIALRNGRRGERLALNQNSIHPRSSGVQEFRSSEVIS